MSILYAGLVGKSASGKSDTIVQDEQTNIESFDDTEKEIIENFTILYFYLSIQ